MGCPGGLRDANDMEVSAKPQEEKSIDWLDLEFWPESDFKVEAMQSNQTFDWVSQPGGSNETQHMHSNHHQPVPVPPQHHQSTANGAPLALFVQPREEESMPIIEVVSTTCGAFPSWVFARSELLQSRTSNHRFDRHRCCRKSKPSCWGLCLRRARTWACRT